MSHWKKKWLNVLLLMQALYRNKMFWSIIFPKKYASNIIYLKNKQPLLISSVHILLAIYRVKRRMIISRSHLKIIKQNVIIVFLLLSDYMVPVTYSSSYLLMLMHF